MENKIKEIIKFNEMKIEDLNNEINNKMEDLKNMVNNDSINDILSFSRNKLDVIEKLNNELKSLKNENDKLYFILNDVK